MTTIMQDVVYGAVDGAALLADIAFEDRSAKKPAVISVHGGRWFRGTRFDDGLDGRPDNGVVLLAEWAKRGYFVARIDYRLVTCTPAPACFQDVMCAVRWVHAHSDEYGIDRSRIFLIGQSAGAHLVALAATRGPDLFRRTGGWDAASADFSAGICVAGPYNLLKLDWGAGWMPPGVGWEEARRFASPLFHIGRDVKPLLFFHAEDDRSVPIAQADEFAAALEAMGANHVYERHLVGGHLKITKTVRDVAFAFIDNFPARGVS